MAAVKVVVDKACDGLDIVNVEHRDRNAPGWLHIAGDGDYRVIVSIQIRLVWRGTMQFYLGETDTLVALNEHDVRTRAVERSDELLQIRFIGRNRELGDRRRPRHGADHGLLGTGFAQPIAVLAGGI
jgi:hypothetical protein